MANWSTEEKDRFVKLVESGVSASVIAERLGGDRSRNSIIGQAMRMGMSIGNGKSNAPKKAKIAKASRRKATAGGEFFRVRSQAKLLPAVDAEAGQGAAVPMIDVMGRYGRCKFYLPGHEGLQGLVCGAGTDIDNPYCAHHHKLTRTAPRVRAAA